MTPGARRMMDGLCWICVGSFATVSVYITTCILLDVATHSGFPRDPHQYWYAFISAAFGALFTLAGFFLGRRLREKEAKIKLAERIEFNCKRMEEIRVRFLGTDMPSFTLDTAGMVIWLHTASGVMKSELVNDIDGYRYQLDHIAEKLRLVQTAFCVDMATNPEKIDEALQKVRLKYEPSLGVVRHIDTEVIRGRELIKRIQGV